jgi:arylsulfatase A-like enzyme
MRKLITLVLLSAVVGVLARPMPDPSPTAQTTRPPNVLVILTDDQRREGTLAVMEELRREFRRRGTEFTQAFVTTPLCCPSRGSIWSGLYTHNHGITSNDGTEFENYPQDLTVQAYLQNAGYTTGYFGKYFNKWPLGEPPPYFDHWAINSRGSNYRFSHFNINGRVTGIDAYDTRFITDHLTEFITAAETDDERPWFAVLAPKAPHGPATPARRYDHERVERWKPSPAVFEEDRSDKHPDVQARNEPLEKAQQRRRQQLRTLLSVDDSIGQTFDLLRGLSEERETLAIFVSDNGLLWREHGIMAKSQPFMPSIQVPLFVRGPGVEQGAVDESLVANIDLAPTILEAAGIVPSEPMDGRSLFSSEERERLLLEYYRSPDFPHTGKWAATLTPEYQYVEYYDDADPQNAVPTFREYYDLVEDPWQLENLFGDLDITNDPNPVLLHQQLQEDRTCRGESCP